MSTQQTMTNDGPKSFGDTPDLVEVIGSDDETAVDVTLGTDEKGEIKVETTPVETEETKTTVTPVTEGGEQKPDDFNQMGQRAQRRIKSLSHNIHVQREARQKAEEGQAEAIKTAQQLKEENDRLRAGMTQTNASYLDTMAERHTARMDGLQKDLETALTAGDSARAAKVQAEMSVVGGELATINQTKVAHKARNPAPPQQQPQPQYQQPAQQQQPVQQQQPASNLHPKTTSWLNKNSEWFNKLDNDQSAQKTEAAFKIHDTLLAEGYTGDQDDYYVELDERLREQFPDHKVSAMTSGNELSGDGQGSQGNNPAVNQQTPALSPYSRQNTSGGGPRTVRLTPTQVSLAKSLGLTLEEYAQSLMEGN